jgi:flavin-dependent thymidylate synthase
MAKFLSSEPDIKLVKAFETPFQNALATARTCYSSSGIVTDDQIIVQKHGPLAQSIYRAGHHTVFAHAQFQFAMSNVSRQFIWSFLHSHCFYNSEQVSQRYVEVKPENFAIPPLEGESLNVYIEAVDYQMEAYRRLVDKLIPIVEGEYHRIFPHRNIADAKYHQVVVKRAREVARYVLPLATFSCLYHTISAITLLRYYRLCRQYDAPLEQQIVIRKMIDRVLELDPHYRIILEEPIDLVETPEYTFFMEHQESVDRRTRRSFIEEFDRSLGGSVSRLVDYKINNEKVLAQSVREVLGIGSGIMGDEEAIDLVLNPDRDRLLGESLNLTTMSKLTRTMHHPGYTFRKRLSHAGDSQNQRHRMTPASRPCLVAHLMDEPDFVTPELVKVDETIARLYREVMDRTWERIRALQRLGVSDEIALYLLPNAVSVRFTESADLLSLHHKCEMRLCYLAQEEIWRASLDEAAQIRTINPLIGRYLLPPCAQRRLAHTRPYCPEGDRYCGVRVWQLGLSDYSRII